MCTFIHDFLFIYLVTYKNNHKGLNQKMETALFYVNLKDTESCQILHFPFYAIIQQCFKRNLEDSLLLLFFI